MGGSFFKTAMAKRYLFLAAYMSMAMFFICAAAEAGKGSIFFKLFSVLMFVLFLFAGNQSYVIDFEKIIMLFGLLLFHSAVFLRGKMQGQYEILHMLCLIVIAAAAVIYMVGHRRRIPIKKWFVANKLLLTFILCFLLLSLEVLQALVMWDARVYFSFAYAVNDIQGMVRNFSADFSSFYNLYLMGHSSLGYSLWILMFQLLKEGIASVQAADICLAGISIYAYYQILRKILGSRYSDKTLVLATAPYAFSPFVMGMIGYVNLDHAMMYVTVIFIACSLYHYECLELVFATFFCFTKEPAVIYYAGYVAAKVLCGYFADHSFHFAEFIKYIFGNIRHYIYAMPLALWGALYFLDTSGGWGNGENTRISMDGSGVHCFGISKNIVLTTLKHMFTLNFNWLFWIGILTGFVWLCVKKVRADKEILKQVIPISMTGIMTVIFCCLYITPTHARYLAPAIPALYVTATVIVAKMKRKVFFIWNLLLSIALFIQCFYTVDPVMHRLYASIETGGAKIYCMAQGNAVHFRDYAVYNRQYIYWQKVLTDIFQKSGYDGKMLIVLPGEPNCTRLDLIGDFETLWNFQTGKLEYFDEKAGVPEQSTLIKVCHVEEAREAEVDNGILYIIPNWGSIDEEFMMDKNVIKQEEVSYRGFCAQYMVLDVEEK